MNLLNLIISPSDTFSEAAEVVSDVLLFVSTIIAVVFIASEYAAEHLNWPWGEKKKKLLAMVVVASLAAEAIFEVCSFWYSYKLQYSQSKQLAAAAGVASDAKANARIANTNAGLANGTAVAANTLAQRVKDRLSRVGKSLEVEQTRLADLRNLEATLNLSINDDRKRLTVTEANAIKLAKMELPRMFVAPRNMCDKLKPFSHLKILIDVVSDFEARSLAAEIFANLRTCELDPQYIPVPYKVYEQPSGVFIGVGPTPSGRSLGILLGQMFDDSSLGDKTMLVDPDIGSLKRTGVPVSILWEPGTEIPDAILEISIGPKPNDLAALNMLGSSWPYHLPAPSTPPKDKR